MPPSLGRRRVAPYNGCERHGGITIRFILPLGMLAACFVFSSRATGTDESGVDAGRWEQTDMRDAPGAVLRPEPGWSYRGTGMQMTPPAQSVGSDSTRRQPRSGPWVAGLVLAVGAGLGAYRLAHRRPARR